MSSLHTIQMTLGAPHGEIWECGVFRGDTAKWIRDYAGPCRTIRLFDTFAGMPVSGPHDSHPIGAMSGTSEAFVRARFENDPNTHFHVGVIPATFVGLEDCLISIINIDVDQYESVKACLEFAYPRMVQGGYVLLDDYKCPDCPGAKKAVDEFMADKPEKLVFENTAQPYFIKR